MNPKTIGIALLIPATLLADFSYTTTTRVTGGAMAAMSRTLGGLSKGMRQMTEGRAQTVAIQGNRKVTYDDQHANIVDLDKETITDINFEKKSYSVVTFAQMREAIKRGMEKAKAGGAKQEESKPSDVEAEFKLDIKETGQTKAVSGINAKEVVMLVQVIGKDKKSGQSGAMDMLNSIWVADPSAVPGHKQEEEFNKKYAEKMAGIVFGGASPQAMMPGMDPKMMAAMRKAAEEGQKLNGVHVLQISKMGTQLDPATASQISNPNDTPQGPTAGQVAGGAAAGAAEGAALGRLGRIGGIGGLGGFGRRKKNKDTEEAKPAEKPAENNQAQASGLMMEMVIEQSNFTTAPVDASRFAVPAGFKQETHPMAKE